MIPKDVHILVHLYYLTYYFVELVRFHWDL
jgi:hypothetical protein